MVPAASMTPSSADAARRLLADMPVDALSELAGHLAAADGAHIIVPETMAEQAQAAMTLARLADTTPAALVQTLMLVRRMTK
jgi:hypothetical protein